jgi:hypothetical protein
MLLAVNTKHSTKGRWHCEEQSVNHIKEKTIIQSIGKRKYNQPGCRIGSNQSVKKRLKSARCSRKIRMEIL